MLVFALCRHAAADVALRLVDGQHVAHLLVQAEVHVAQPLRHVLMYRGFADAELLRGAPDRRLVPHDIFPKQ